MDDEKEETGGKQRVGTSKSNHLKNNHLSNVNIGTKDVDAMLEQACQDRDKDLDKLMNPYGDTNVMYGFHVKNGTSEFDATNHDIHTSNEPRSPFVTQQSSFFTSSPRPKPKPASQDINTEILHLVDSAIMGQPESIETMKSMVSCAENFGDGVDADSVAYLLVDTLLTTMGGVESFEEDDDNNSPTVMKNSIAAIISAELLPWLPWLTDSVGFMSPRTRLIRGLRTILRACTRNRAMCCSAGLIGVLLKTAEKIFLDDVGSTKQLKWNGAPLCSCLQYLAGHSVSVADLNTWFRLVKRMIKTPWAPRLMTSLEKALGGKESRGPQTSFEFDGESSGLIGPGEGRWPFPNGYAFATWLFVETFADTLHTAPTAASIAAEAGAKSGKFSASSAAAVANKGIDEGTTNMPRLFCFVSSDNQGIEAYFHAQFLVVESSTGKARKGPVYFSYAFKTQCWYFIGIEHTSNGELRLYIDGRLHETRSFDLPRFSKPLSFISIGTNPPPRMGGLHQKSRQCPLFAEMGPIYIFKEPVRPEIIGRLASRGADTLPSFGNAAGLMWLSTNAHVANIEEESARLDADIAGYLHLIYHPCLLNGRHCPDASPSGPSGLLQRPAEVLGHVPVTTRMRPTEALWALAYGGPMSLLPFVVSKVDNDTLEPEKGNLKSCLASTALAASVFRIISLAIQHLGNSNELCRTRGPEVLSKILTYLLKTLSSIDVAKHTVADEEIVAAVVSLCQSQKNNSTLKMQLFSTLLLDLKIWSLCNYGIQKKLLSSLADMVCIESSVMRDAKAIQTLLDGCRRCYWTIHEKDSMNTFSINGGPRPVGEVNALVDELLVVIELLLVEAPPPMAVNDIRCLLGFLVDCPQPNQVARTLHLINRLVVQPNTSRAENFAEAFISCGGIETLLVLLQREAKAGDNDAPDIDDDTCSISGSKAESVTGFPENSNTDEFGSVYDSEISAYEPHRRIGTMASSIGSRTSASESLIIKTLGGITFSITPENARNNVYNIDKTDGTVVAIIGLFGALVISGHLKFGSHAPPDLTGNLPGLLEGAGSMYDDKVSLLHFVLQKTLQAAPNRLMTMNVYTALLSASLNASAMDEDLNPHDPQLRFQNLEVLLVLFRSLPYSSESFQIRALKDLLILVVQQSENRRSLAKMEEWPEWLLEILISNYEMGVTSASMSSSISYVEDLIYSLLNIMIEHSLFEKDGWKDIEATLHCAEWLAREGGSSTGEQRARREKSLPVFKRRLLSELLEVITNNFKSQIRVIALGSAGEEITGMEPAVSKEDVEDAVRYSEALVENAIVTLMLVEDHLRLQSKLICSTHFQAGSTSPLSSVQALVSSPSSISKPLEGGDSSKDSEVPFDVLASMVDDKEDFSASTMERLTAAAAAEPYDSVSCAFVSYGSCVIDLAEGWKYRSRLWYGIGKPSDTTNIGGGGSGWDSWKSCLEKDSNGNWVEIPLIKKCVLMLQTLLLDEHGFVDGLGMSGTSGTGMGNVMALYQLLDSDQPFLCMLRMTLLALREDDGDGENGMIMKNVDAGLFEKLHREDGSAPSSLESSPRTLMNQPGSPLLWSVLSPILHMPVSESKRQRVLVASCVLYSEVWHAVSRNRLPLRKQYLEAIVPPLVAVIRRWRPLLAKIYELSPPDGYNPLVVDDPSLVAEANPTESALAMITPGWVSAFASPPAALALAMIAAGAAGGETTAPTPTINMHLKRDSSTLLERKSAKLHTFSSFQEPLGASKKSSVVLKDKATARAAALAAARDVERNAKIGSGRGLSAVAMATSAQRRSKSNMERNMRWNVSEAMGTAWMECLQSVDTKSVYGKDFNALSYKFVALLVGSLAFARNMQRSEVDRRARVDFIARHRLCTGIRAWRKLIHYLIETDSLFGLLSKNLCDPKRVFWKIDYMESSSRMHRCLRRDFKGSDHSGVSAIYKDPMELEHDKQKSILALEALSTELANEVDDQDVVVNMEGKTDEMWLYEDIHTRPSATSEQQLQVPMDSSEPQVTSCQDLAQSPSAAVPGYIPNEHYEIIILELPASMVRPLKVRHGTFQITTRRINFLVDKSEKKVKDKVEDKDRSWLMASLHQVHNRRYLLRKSALEIFMLDRSNFFFDFGSSEARMSAYRAIIHARPPRLNSIYLATQRPEQLLKRTQLMERWSRWEISNFEYLMQLNTLAGRSYNDITQYPIFPWVLSDYKSTHLDLANPSSYRDLSKPIGALNDDRLKKFHEKYSSFNDPVIPKYHYGSHYSTAGTVLYYLMRVEPFTTLSVRLQGGKFDHTDRMFSDIGTTWTGVLEDMTDVKELVPELFYLPEILTNENSIDFGTTQHGDKLDSVRLPPWAENPVDFITKHQMALESEHVSAHLHEWIDLIFGYKQQGKEAISANNVFFYVTYEGAVDIDRIQDPVQRRAVEDQVAYFGQTPSRLLAVPHIKKMPLSDVLHMQTIFRNPKEVKQYRVPYPNRCNLPASAIHATSDALVIVDTDAPSAKIALHKWHPNTPDENGMPFIFQPGKNNINTSGGGGGFMRMFRGRRGSTSKEWTYPQAHAHAALGIRNSSIVSITYNNEVIMGGHVDNSIRLVSPDGAKTLEIARGHCAPVTCLSLSPDSKYLVSGSRDTTVLVWRIHRSPRFGSGSMSEPPTGSVTPTSVSATTAASCFIDKNRRRRIEGPIQVVRGHLGEIIDCCVNSDLGAVASCSYISDVLVHSVSRGRLLRKLHGVKADIVRLSKNGVVLTWNDSVHALSSYTLNGILIAQVQLPFSCSISCMEISFDGRRVLLGLNSSSKNNHDGGLKDVGETERLNVQYPSVCLLDLHTLKSHLVEEEMSEFQTIGGVKKLGNSNYNSWSTCMSSYLLGQDLWDVVDGESTREPRIDTNNAIHKWHVKTGKALFIIKTTIEEELLEHIRDFTTPKEAWDALKTLFSKKNDTRLQLLENELLSISQGDLTIPKFFHKVKTLCREIGELDAESRIAEPRIKRIIIHGLKPEFRSFVAAIQGWPTQPSLVEFENLLASEESLAKQMGNTSISSTSKNEDEVLYVEKGKVKSRPNNKHRGPSRYNDRYKRSDQSEKKHADSDRGERPDDRKTYGKKPSFKCYRCGYKGHIARNCRVKVNEEGNTATVDQEDGWDVEALVAQTEDVVAFTATTEKKKNSLDEWIVDSGASNHLTGEKDRLQNPIKYGGSRVVVIADNSKHPIAHIGDVVFPSSSNKRELTLRDVYHVPGVKKNLISVPQMTDDGLYVLLGPKDVKVFKEFETPSIPILQGRKTETVYVLNVESPYVEKTKGKQSAELWHQRLGHIGFDKLGLIMKKGLVNGLPNLEVNKNVVCSGCQYGKATQLPFKSSQHRSTSPLQLVHSDVFGPVKQSSMQGMKFMVTFIDDFSRFVWIYFMKEKSEVFSKFREFEVDSELMTGGKIKCLRSDNGGEYLSHEFSNYLKQKRIRRQLTCPNTPQQNGISERKNRHLGEVTKSFVHDKNMPGRFWAEAMRAACYVINRVPSQNLDYVSPYETLTATKPNVSYLRVFGCVCYVFVPAHLRHKMEKKAIRCVFVGYDQQRKGWRCCDPNSGKVYVSRNVIFDEQSSWWSSENQVLPDTNQLKEDLKKLRSHFGF